MKKKEQNQLNIKLNINGEVKNIKISNISMLQQQIDIFLKQNKLEIKYKEHILKRIRNQLYKQDVQIKPRQVQIKNNRLYKIQKIRQQIVNEGNNQESQKQQKDSIIDNFQRQSFASSQESRFIYQKWKNIQKKKNQSYNQSKISKSHIIKTETAHYPPEHMYLKGILHKKQKQDKMKAYFNQLYPFKLNPAKQLTKDDQKKLYNKLYNQRQYKCQHKHYKSYNQYQNSQGENNSSRKFDKIKQQMKMKDAIIDYQIYRIIKDNKEEKKRQYQ